MLSIGEQVDEVGSELRRVRELKSLRLEWILIVGREGQVGSIMQLSDTLQVLVIKQIKVLIIGLHWALLQAFSSRASFAAPRNFASLRKQLSHILLSFL